MLRKTWRYCQQSTTAGNTQRPKAPDTGKLFAAVRSFWSGNAQVFLILATFGISTYTLYNSVFFVQGGTCAVKFNALTGLSTKIYGEGANLAIPFLETPIIFDLRNRPTEIITATGSKDLQMISLAVRVLYKPDPAQIPEIYRRLGVQYADVVLPSVINEVVKAIIAQFNASELLTRRPEVSRKIETELRARAAGFSISISDVSITQMSFGAEYTAAIEAKQIALQNAEKAKFVVEQAMQEKKSAILLAEGEAEAARLIGEAMRSSPGFVELRRVENAKLIAKELAEGRGSYYLDSGIVVQDMKGAGSSGYSGSAAPSAAPAQVKNSGWL